MLCISSAGDFCPTPFLFKGSSFRNVQVDKKQSFLKTYHLFLPHGAMLPCVTSITPITEISFINVLFFADGVKDLTSGDYKIFYLQKQYLSHKMRV